MAKKTKPKKDAMIALMTSNEGAESPKTVAVIAELIGRIEVLEKKQAKK